MGSKYTFQREVEGVKVSIEGEVLPSGAVMVVFEPALPGRPKVLGVDEDEVADLVRAISCAMDYDEDNECMSMTLPLVLREHMTDNPDAPGYKTVTQMVPANVIVEMVIDQMTEACPHCGKFQYGVDVQPSEAATGNDKPPKTYLN